MKCLKFKAKNQLFNNRYCGSWVSKNGDCFIFYKFLSILKMRTSDSGIEFNKMNADKYL